LRAAPIFYYGSQSNGQTIDQGEGGGNPFASALVELLARPRLTLTSLNSDLVKLTKRKSAGRQHPETSETNVVGDWVVRPTEARAKREALVFVYANYAQIAQPSLPGAVRDLGRI
jgi:hypothetical protein